MIYQQSVFEPWPIESESVQAVITSPPYFALRKYSIPDVIIGDWKGQYGLEESPSLYVEHTRLWVKEAWRVLRNDGIFFLNLADSYSGSGCGTNDYRTEASKSINDVGKNVDLYKTGGITQKLKDYPRKGQLLIPHRVAIALVDDGWTLRNTIIWYKTNGMPESVTDRFSKKYEYIFMFTKQEKYYFDLDSIREPVIGKAIRSRVSTFKKVREIGLSTQGNDIIDMSKGKNPGDVWQIPTQPSSEKHFAMWPERLVERMVKCSTKAGDIILDPFAGSGTTLKVAEQLHRKGIGIDLGYHEMSNRRTSKIQKQLFV